LRPASAGAAGDRPDAGRLPGHRRRSRRGRPRLGSVRQDGHRRLVGDPRGAAGGGGGKALRRRRKSRARESSATRCRDDAVEPKRKGEVDFLVHCFKRFAARPVRRVVDIACGTGPHLMRLADRGYQMSGLDLSPRNVQFLRERLARKGHEGELVVGDMTDFRLARPVDAAVCMQDSQGHLLKTEQLVAHLKAVARCLRRGGLYVFDRYMVSSWTNPARRWTWSKRRGRLIVRASFSALNDVDPVSQVFRERMTLEAIENGTRRVYR